MIYSFGSALSRTKYRGQRSNFQATDICWFLIRSHAFSYMNYLLHCAWCIAILFFQIFWRPQRGVYLNIYGIDCTYFKATPILLINKSKCFQLPSRVLNCTQHDTLPGNHVLFNANCLESLQVLLAPLPKKKKKRNNNHVPSTCLCASCVLANSKMFLRVNSGTRY